MTLTAITRAFTLLYTTALLILFTRIQLNLLGRLSYLSSVVSLATDSPARSGIQLQNNDDDNIDRVLDADFDINRDYLTFSWWLLHRGWKGIRLRVEQAVTEVFGNVAVTESIDVVRFSALTLRVRGIVEGSTEEERHAKKWLAHLLPDVEEDQALVLQQTGVSLPGPDVRDKSSAATARIIQPKLKQLLDETADLIDSPSFSHILTLLLDSGFSTLVDLKLRQMAFEGVPEFSSEHVSRTANDPAARVTEIPDTKAVKVPKILAPLTRQAHAIGSPVDNDYMSAMNSIGELEAFAAVIYAGGWQEGNARPSHSVDNAASELPMAADRNGQISPSEKAQVSGQDALEGAWAKAIGVPL